MSSEMTASHLIVIRLFRPYKFLPRDATQSAVPYSAAASRLSVRLSVCPSVDVEVLWSHRLEIFKDNFTVR